MNDNQPTRWRKSSYSDHQGGDCVEIAELSGLLAIRDSKNSSGHVHLFGKSAFLDFARRLSTEA